MMIFLINNYLNLQFFVMFMFRLQLWRTCMNWHFEWLRTLFIDETLENSIFNATEQKNYDLQSIPNSLIKKKICN